MRRKLAALLGATAVVWAGLAARRTPLTRQALVLHAVPGLTRRLVNGDRTISTQRAPWPPAHLRPELHGHHRRRFQLRSTGNRPFALKLKAGGNYTAVAHLTRAGHYGPLFTNDTSKTDAGQGRLTSGNRLRAEWTILAGGDALVATYQPTRKF